MSMYIRMMASTSWTGRHSVIQDRVCGLLPMERPAQLPGWTLCGPPQTRPVAPLQACLGTPPFPGTLGVDVSLCSCT